MHKKHGLKKTCFFASLVTIAQYIAQLKILPLHDTIIGAIKLLYNHIDCLGATINLLIAQSDWASRGRFSHWYPERYDVGAANGYAGYEAQFDE